MRLWVRRTKNWSNYGHFFCARVADLFDFKVFRLSFPVSFTVCAALFLPLGICFLVETASGIIQNMKRQNGGINNLGKSLF